MEGNYVKIIFTIDESGSMHGSENDVIGGFNNFIKTQKEEQTGKIDVSLYKFNTEVSTILKDLPIEKIEPITKRDYSPNGSTALFDAIGISIEETDKKIGAMAENERPDKVVLVIITDGEENSSKHYSLSTLKQILFTHQELMKWEVVFLGAGLDNFVDAESLGVKNRGASTKASLAHDFDAISEYSSVMRCKRPEVEEQYSLDLMMSKLNKMGKKK